ncbi:MAG: FkbM family methyltransferase [Anaerolineae bacterium]|nr:FkbM family methyltransferase [Anaerolineae bacterium]
MSNDHFSKHNPVSHTSVPAPIIVNQYMSLKKCRHGLMLYNLNDLFVGRSMDLYGEWCEAELNTLGQLLLPGDVVIDVGANIGTHSVFFAQKVGPQGLVYAIEPQRITYEILCANIALNTLLNALPMQVAIGEKNGKIIIPVLNPESQQNFAAFKIEGHKDGDVVNLLPLDELNLSRCKLIKIDVEGMELKVLHGAQKTIQQLRPFLFVENNSREGSPETVQALFDLGYKCWWHIANYFNPDNYFQNKENIFAQFVPESNMICVPGEFNFNVTGFEAVTSPNDTWISAVERINSSQH